MSEVIMGIYKITSPSNRIYIGQSINIKRRFKCYKSNYNCKSQAKLVNSFLKYGVENHVFEIIEVCKIEDLNNRERYWQIFFNAVNEGLNCILQKDDIERRKLGEETKKKMSESNKKAWASGKRVMTVEHLQKLTESHVKAFKGKKHTNETKEKMSVAKLGKKKSEETKEKMRKPKTKEHSENIRKSWVIRKQNKLNA